MSGLLNPPRYFQDVDFQSHSQRSVSWLELFYDLVYVATLGYFYLPVDDLPGLVNH